MITQPVLEFARRQHGLVSRLQLLEETATSASQISRALNARRLTALLPGVYLVAPAPETFHARCMALQLHARGTGFLSGWTAGRLRGLRRMPEYPIHYTVPAAFGRITPTWSEVHRTSWYDEDRDRETHESGLVLATPLRMLFGLAAAFGQSRFEGAAEDTWHLKLASPLEASRYLEDRRCRGKDGVSTIEAWLDKALLQQRPAQSYFERDLIAALLSVGLPAPERQHRLELTDGRTIHLDIAWPDIRLAIEPGHSWWHGGDSAQEYDQRRDLACAEIGWQIQRLSEGVQVDLTRFARMIRTVHRQRKRDLLGGANPRRH